MFVRVFPQGTRICIQVIFTCTPTHTHPHTQGLEREEKWETRGSEAAKHELWILKDFPALQDCEKDRDEDVRPKIYRGKIRWKGR